MIDGECPAAEQVDDEAAYYRAIEDLFARLRGTPFLLSPKDFALMREWWRAGVPFAAVLAGVTEVFARRREQDGNPVSSLWYCRHAVGRNATRLLATTVGEPAAQPPLDAAAALASLAARVEASATAWTATPGVVAAIADLAHAIATLPAEAAPAALDETLARLEAATLAVLAGEIPADLAAAVERDLREQLGPVEEKVRVKVERAARLKLVRQALGLPRLELVVAGA